MLTLKPYRGTHPVEKHGVTKARVEANAIGGLAAVLSVT
jgi:hypothetical protein